MSVSDTSTVGEVATRHPNTIALLQQYGIDFCCGGDKLLGTACNEKGLSLELVRAAAKAQQREEANIQWSSATATELIDHIVGKHHAYLWAELPRLSAALAKVIEVHGPSNPESLYPLRDVYAALDRELEQHMWKEENILFPLIKRIEKARAMGVTPLDAPIRAMEMEHESAGKALAEIRRLTSDYQTPAGACNLYRALLDGLRLLETDLQEHIHLENNILFPKVLQRTSTEAR